MACSDPSSQANIEEWKTKHIDLNWIVDFETKQLKGSATLSINKVGEHNSNIFLDTRDLSITDAFCNDEKVNFNLHDLNACFGSRLEVDVSRFASSKELNLRIGYATSPKSSALQWMSPMQTRGRQHPYMFSQCQAIHARSMLPCQDTPAIKASYTARVEAPKELEVLMSAIRTKTEDAGQNRRAHFFEQKVPIPSYLTAVVSGHLASRRVGPRCQVWSEPEMVEECAFEFSETEDMLKTAEELCGPYVWGIYDLLILPPSFPYGGMENPCLTFVTPTLLAGDRSLSNVVAHEIAHSWTGNLVTNRTWEHFWLNEGHTVFVERKILARLAGEAGVTRRHLHMLGGQQSLRQEVDRRGAQSPMTALVPRLDGVDPDEAFSCVPYEKGSALLFHIESLVGEELMNKWLRAYIDNFSHRSIETSQWKDFLFSFFTSHKVDTKSLENIDWNAWLHQPGFLPEAPALDTSLADAATALAAAWIAKGDGSADPEGAAFAAFSPNQRILFLEHLRSKAPPKQTVEILSDFYELGKSKNSEIRHNWLLLGLAVHSEQVVAPTIAFLNEQGRMKFTRPLYRALNAWEEKSGEARRNFEDQRPYMHPITAQMVAADLGL